MVFKIGHIVVKNFKVLFRSKLSSMIIILGPLLLVLLLGSAFNTSSSYFVQVGAYSTEYTELTDSIVQRLDEHDFRVNKYESEEDCITSTKEDITQVCIVFSEDFSVQMEKTSTITFNIDYSDINLVFIILDMISKQVTLESREITEELSGDVLTKLSETQLSMDNQSKIIATLKDNEESVKAYIDTISVNVNDIDLSMAKNDFKVDDLAGLGDTSGNNFEDIKTKAFNLVDDVDDYMDDIADAVDDLDDAASGNISDEVDAIYDLINDTMEKAIKYKKSIEDSYNESIADLDDLKDNIEQMETAVSDLDLKLALAQTKKTAVIESLNEAKKKVDDSLKIINEVEAMMVRMNANILGLEITDAGKIATPITTEIKPITEQRSHFYNLFPTLIVLIIMFTSILLGSTFIMLEKKSKAFMRNFLTPTSHLTFNMGTYLTTLFIVIFQALILILIAFFYFNIPLPINSFTISTAIFILANFFIISLFICVGMFIGYLYRTEETNILASISIIFLFIFFSNTLLPLQSMPDYFVQIAGYNPFVISVELIKKIVVFDLAWSSMANDVYLMMGYTISFFVLLQMFQSVFRRMFFMNKFKLYVPSHKKEDKKVDKKKPVETNTQLDDIEQIKSMKHKMSKDEILLSISRKFVKDKKGYWNHKDWKQLLSYIQRADIRVDQEKIAHILAKEKDRYFKINLRN